VFAEGGSNKLIKVKYDDTKNTLKRKPWHPYISDICEIYEGDTPDFVFCSLFGRGGVDYDAPRVVFIGENISPDFNRYDYAVSFNNIEFGDRYFRLPLYAWYPIFTEALEKHEQFAGQRKQKFCGIAVSNTQWAAPAREQFFKRLSEYKHVDSSGMAWNNIGGAIPQITGREVIEFYQDHRFTIAFENSSVPGYITEKIIRAWAAGTIPIYWGAPDIAEHFNTEAFVNCHDFESFEQVVERIDEIENDDELYMHIMKQPIVKEGSLARQFSIEKLGQYLRYVLTQEPEKAKRRPEYGWAMGVAQRSARWDTKKLAFTVLSAYERIKAYSADPAKKVYIRGAGRNGRALLAEMAELGVHIDAFIDTNADVSGHDIPIVSPDSVYATPLHSYYVIVSVGRPQVFAEIRTEMEFHGLATPRDFVDYGTGCLK
jgi:hypothetical protein